MKRSYSTLKYQFQGDVDAQLQNVLDTAPARRWSRLETMAEAGHAGAAAVMGSAALDEAQTASPLVQFFGAHTHNYEIAYENLRRYQIAGGDVDVSADIARAAEALPEDRVTALEASAQEWGVRHAPATPEVAPEAEPETAQPEAAPEIVEPEAEVPAEETPVEETPAEEVTAEEPAVTEDAPAEEAVAETPEEEVLTIETPEESVAGPSHYLVERGDTLSELMVEKYGITGWSNIQEAYTQIAELSGVANPDKIYANETVLTLPRELTLSNGQTFPLLSGDEPGADVSFERHVARHGGVAPDLTNSFTDNAPITEIPNMDDLSPVIRRVTGTDFIAA